MSAPGIPSGFFVQQSAGEAFLSWNIQAGATSYSVQRSADGVTYAVVGTPSVNSYLDTTTLVNTQYYYQVAAVNADGISPYTQSQSVIPTLIGKISLGELRLRCQQKADRVNSNFVTLPEWNFFINQARYELYDLLITVYEDYYVAPRLTFSTDGTTQSYDLPNGANYSGAPAFYKMYGMDLGLDSTSNAAITLRKFSFIERNRYVYPQLTSTYFGVFNLRYRVVGDEVMFIPTPSGGQIVGMWYYPRLESIVQDIDVVDGISGWEAYVIARAAKYALDKEESDTTKLDAEIIYLKQRVEESASNRDAGQPDTISNTRSSSESWGYNGMGGDSSGGGW